MTTPGFSSPGRPKVRVQRSDGGRPDLQWHESRGTTAEQPLPVFLAPPCQKRAREPLSPRRRRALAVAAEALLDNADLLRVGTITPPTGLVRREDLKVQNDLRACHRA